MSTINELHISAKHYTKVFDFDKYIDDPKIQLMIAATPRSGSTAFCLELWKTGLLGAPLEYANLNIIRKVPRWHSLRKKALLSDNLIYEYETKATAGVNLVYDSCAAEYGSGLLEFDKKLPSGLRMLVRSLSRNANYKTILFFDAR